MGFHEAEKPKIPKELIGPALMILTPANASPPGALRLAPQSVFELLQALPPRPTGQATRAA